jgi:DNA invertase Pin-like site-specific DNA recombinase
MALNRQYRNPAEAAFSGTVLLYARVSDGPGQLGNGSCEHQTTELVNRLIRAGADPARIRVIDEDLGKSSVHGVRSGWDRLNEAVLKDPTVTCVAMAEFSRLGRNPIEVLGFLKICELRGIYISENGVLRDLRLESDSTLAGIQTVLAAAENQRRTTRMRDAKQAKTRKGLSIHRLPAGLERTKDRKIVLAADPRECAAIARVWKEALS